MAQLLSENTPLIISHQVHGTDVLEVDGPWRSTEVPKADGLVTTKAGLALGIIAADCAPVLLADSRNPVIGVAHAGWRGASQGIIEAVIKLMITLGAQKENIAAGIGPTIGRDSYEVGTEFFEQFLTEDSANAAFFKRGAGQLFFDLNAYIAKRLRECDINNVQAGGWDTFRDKNNFFSYRRSSRNQEPDYGRQLSAIALNPI